MSIKQQVMYFKEFDRPLKHDLIINKKNLYFSNKTNRDTITPQVNYFKEFDRPIHKIVGPRPRLLNQDDEEGQIVRLSEDQLGSIDVPVRDKNGQIIRYDKKPFNFSKALEILKAPLSSNLRDLNILTKIIKESSEKKDDEAINVGLIIKKLLNNVDKLDSLQLQEIYKGLDILDKNHYIEIPTEPTQANLNFELINGRFSTFDNIKLDVGGLLQFLLGNAKRRGLDIVNPVIGINGYSRNIKTFINDLNRGANKDRILDLATSKIYRSINDVPPQELLASQVSSPDAEMKLIEGEILGHRQNLREANNNLKAILNLPENEQVKYSINKETNERIIRDSNDAINKLQQQLNEIRT